MYTCLQHQSSQEAAHAAERIVRYRQAVQRSGLYTTPSPGGVSAPPHGLYDAATHTARGLPVYGTMGFEPGKVYCATVSPHAFEVTLGATPKGAAAAGGGGGFRSASGGQRARGAGGRAGVEDGRDLPPVRTDDTLPKLVITVDKRGQSTGVPAYGRVDAASLVPSASLQTGTSTRSSRDGRGSGSGVGGPPDVVVEVRAPSKFRWKPPQALPAGAPWVPGPGDAVHAGGGRAAPGLGGGRQDGGATVASPRGSAPGDRERPREERRVGDVERGSRPVAGAGQQQERQGGGSAQKAPGISSSHAARSKDARAWRGDVNNKL